MKTPLTLALFSFLLMPATGTVCEQSKLPAASSGSLYAGSDLVVGLSTRSALSESRKADLVSLGKSLKLFDCQLDLASQQWSGTADDHVRHAASWSGAGPNGERCLTTLFVEGAVIFAPDLAAIQSISPGGYFELSASFGTHFRKFIAKPDNLGTVDVAWSADGSTKFSESGEEHPPYAAFLLPLERCLAFSANTRLPALMQNGGLHAVLDEIDRLQTDYARHLYLKLLISNIHLDESEVRQVLVAIGRRSLDGQRGSTLTALATKYPLVDDQTWRAFLKSAESVTPIRDQQNALQALLKNQHLSDLFL